MIAMVSIHIDLPIFSSPTEPHGGFSGDVELDRQPRKDEPFPWPARWLAEHRELFEAQSAHVWGDLTDWPYPPSALHATMYGIVCADSGHARQVAEHIERCSGIRYDEHPAR